MSKADQAGCVCVLVLQDSNLQCAQRPFAFSRLSTLLQPQQRLDFPPSFGSTFAFLRASSLSFALLRSKSDPCTQACHLCFARCFSALDPLVRVGKSSYRKQRLRRSSVIRVLISRPEARGHIPVSFLAIALEVFVRSSLQLFAVVLCLYLNLYLLREFDL